MGRKNRARARGAASPPPEIGAAGGPAPPCRRGVARWRSPGSTGKVYAVGGFTSGNQGAVMDVYAYDVATDAWEELASLRAPRSSVAVTELDDKIHAIGGHDTQNVGTHEVYDPATDTWEELAPMPTLRHGFGAATVGGTVYLPADAPMTGGGQQSDVLETFSLS